MVAKRYEFYGFEWQEHKILMELTCNFFILYTWARLFKRWIALSTG